MEPILTALLPTSLFIFIFVSVLFLVSLVVKRNDIADVAWGTGIFLVAFMSFLATTEKTLISYILIILAALWGFRLTIRILLRNLKKAEDYRYKKWREEWGRWFYIRSYFQVYILQGTLMLVVGYPFIHLASFGTDSVLTPLIGIGVLIWCIGYFFEIVGDWQLDRFLSNPENRGKIMQSGLWYYSRHPNYFGEITMWWAIFMIVVSSPLGLVAIVSPVTITLLITKVSGIPMLEKHFAGNQEFEAYKAKTSVLIPLPPKR
jgi:steroid 5-alpha reductase family enzyme